MAAQPEIDREARGRVRKRDGLHATDDRAPDLRIPRAVRLYEERGAREVRQVHHDVSEGARLRNRLHPGVRDHSDGSTYGPRLRAGRPVDDRRRRSRVDDAVEPACATIDDAAERSRSGEGKGVLVIDAAGEVLETGERDVTDGAATGTRYRPRRIDCRSDERVVTDAPVNGKRQGDRRSIDCDDVVA